MNTQQEQDRMILSSAPTDQPLNDIELAALERERDREATATPAQASGNCPTSHSPLPWNDEQTGSVYSSDGFKVAGCDCHFRTTPEIKANAALIVRACNEYEKMVPHEVYDRDKLKAHAQRLADALKQIAIESGDKSAKLGNIAREALAQWNEGK